MRREEAEYLAILIMLQAGDQANVITAWGLQVNVNLATPKFSSH